MSLVKFVRDCIIDVFVFMIRNHTRRFVVKLFCWCFLQMLGVSFVKFVPDCIIDVFVFMIRKHHTRRFVVKLFL